MRTRRSMPRPVLLEAAEVYPTGRHRGPTGTTGLRAELLADYVDRLARGLSHQSEECSMALVVGYLTTGQRQTPDITLTGPPTVPTLEQGNVT